jgi:hypothetical protein
MTSPNAPAPPQLSDDEIAALSPRQREEYFQQQADAGVDNGGLIGWAERMVGRVQGQARAEEVHEQNIQELSSGDVQYVQGLQPSNADYQGHEHAQLAQYVTQNLDPNQVGEVSDAYFKLHEKFKTFADRLKDAVAKSQHEWEGPAAEDARGYFTNLQTWADGNSQNAKLASETIYQQSEAATSAKNRMPEEIPFDWDSEMKKWGENPLDIVGNIERSYQTYQASNEAHAEAARVMNEYDGELYTAASKQPVFAEPPKFGESGGSPSPTMPGPGNGGTAASGFTPPPSSTPPSSSLPSGGFPGGGGSGGGGTPPGGIGGPAPVPNPLPGGRRTGSVTPGGTNPTGYRPPNFTPPPRRGGGNSSNTGFGGMAPMPMGGAGGGFGPGGSSEYSGKMGRGGGFGPAGGGTPGSGAASGAARPGALGAAEAAAGRAGGAGAAGGAAGRGMGPAGMGGAGGRGGQGSEDQEHQRPTYLVEGDPDEVFGTDQRTAPPVIGE